MLSARPGSGALAHNASSRSLCSRMLARGPCYRSSRFNSDLRAQAINHLRQQQRLRLVRRRQRAQPGQPRRRSAPRWRLRRGAGPMPTSDTVLNVSISARRSRSSRQPADRQRPSGLRRRRTSTAGLGSRITSRRRAWDRRRRRRHGDPAGARGPGRHAPPASTRRSAARASPATSGSLVAVGTTTIQDLDLMISAIPVDPVSLRQRRRRSQHERQPAALGIANASLILNEQIIAGDQSSIVVNAFHLNVNVANSIVAQVILGHFASADNGGGPFRNKRGRPRRRLVSSASSRLERTGRGRHRTRRATPTCVSLPPIAERVSRLSNLAPSR